MRKDREEETIKEAEEEKEEEEGTEEEEDPSSVWFLFNCAPLNISLYYFTCRSI